MMDMYPALTCGACVYIIGEDIRLNLPDLNTYFNDNGITHSFITTQVGYQFATNVDNRSLKHFSVGGEKLSALQPPKNYKMYNAYGPTECTIFTTTYCLKDYEMDIPIGKPLDNFRLAVRKWVEDTSTVRRRQPKCLSAIPSPKVPICIPVATVPVILYDICPTAISSSWVARTDR